MSRYDGLIIPRSYNEYINKTDAATLQQALQLSGVLSGAVDAGDNKAVKSSAVKAALANYSKFPDWAHQQRITLTDITVDQDVFIILHQVNNVPMQPLRIDGAIVSVQDNTNNIYSITFCGFVKKGSLISYPYLDNPNVVQVYPLI